MYGLSLYGDCIAKVVQLLQEKKVEVEALVTHEFDWASAEEAFKLVRGPGNGVVMAIIKGLVDDKLRMLGS